MFAHAPRAVRHHRLAFLILATSCAATPDVPVLTRYDDLVALFHEWREFESPPIVGGIHAYTSDAMAAQHRDLADLQRRLAAFDTTGWSISQQVDWHLVRAEMHGLDFDHRVRQPWTNNPAFYAMIFAGQSDVPAHEGPVIHGWIDLWTYEYPLSVDAAADLAQRIGTIPAVLTQARDNLTGNATDLWSAGIRSIASQVSALDAFAEQVAGTNAELDGAVVEARDATASFQSWLEGTAGSKTGPSGVGRENYTWYLQNVHLVPYTWEEQVTLMRRELARAHAALRLEEHRNRELPPLTRIDNAAEYDRAFNAAVDTFVRFLGARDIVAVRDYMAPALRARIGTFSPAQGLRNFFSEVSYRDPLTMRTHDFHWIELERMVRDPHPSPIRRVPSLSNIYDSRSEGLATGMEEMMMHAGLFDGSPRTRELIWILLAQRAARALGGLYMHANEWTMEEAVAFASEWTPRGWLPADGALVRGEQHLYLQQPGYGTSYVVGKIQIEQLMARRGAGSGGDFALGRFMDEFLVSCNSD